PGDAPPHGSHPVRAVNARIFGIEAGAREGQHQEGRRREEHEGPRLQTPGRGRVAGGRRVRQVPGGKGSGSHVTSTPTSTYPVAANNSGELPGLPTSTSRGRHPERDMACSPGACTVRSSGPEAC